MNASHKHWCFTSFDLTLLDQFPVLTAQPVNNFAYLICQVETAPDTQRQHIQGYVEFTDRVGLRTAKLRLGDPTAHLEPRRGMGARSCHVISAWPGLTFIQEHENKRVSTPVKKKRVSVVPSSSAPSKRIKAAGGPISSASGISLSKAAPTVTSSKSVPPSTSSTSVYEDFVTFFSEFPCQCYVCWCDRRTIDDFGPEAVFRYYLATAGSACFLYWMSHREPCCPSRIETNYYE